MQKDPDFRMSPTWLGPDQRCEAETIFMLIANDPLSDLALTLRFLIAPRRFMDEACSVQTDANPAAVFARVSEGAEDGSGAALVAEHPRPGDEPSVPAGE
jgi:hypothetical protein